MIVDAFMFANEADILRMRLQELDDLVDTFVIVEMDVTHVGTPKESVFQQLARADPVVKRFLPKIHAVVVRAPPTKDPWTLENAQRNGVADALAELRLPPDAIVMNSDADEIPRPAAIRAHIRSGRAALPHSCEQLMFYYSFEHLFYKLWHGTTVASYREFANRPPQHWRDLRAELPRIHNAGWHAGYFGDAAFVANKVRNTPHQELNSEAVIAGIEESIRSGTDLFGRPDVFFLECPPDIELPKFASEVGGGK